ncbi:M16 family metallopeptidase [Microlunatus sp. Y2014]|uniref:M16 family metallopeptidase n=1 Tax=Microlunatus sp. Y2014 TaxID=3418488 RepID=UPI003DA6D901
MTGSTTPAPARPTVADPQPWSFPTPVTGRLSNGMAVVHYDLPGQYVVSASLVLDHSLAAEPTELEGITAMAMRTITDGTGPNPGERFTELLENQGAAVGADVGQSGTQVMMDVPAPRLGAAMALFAEAIREPALADEDVRRQVALRQAEIDQTRANSAATATLAFRRRVLHPDARAGRPTGGEHETVAALEAEAVREWYAGHVGPERATLVLGGEFAEDPMILAEECFGDWERATGVVEHPRPDRGASRCVIIHRPGAVQADIRLGGWGVDRDDPRWPALRVAVYPMGGSFNSRLNAELREARGYTYGVRLAFTPLRAGGYFATQGSFRTDVVGPALTTARELLDLGEQSFTDEEVRDAKAYMTGTSPLQYATADGVVDQAGLQLIMDLPQDYLDQSLAKVLAVTPHDASEAYRSVVDTDDLTCVIVGDADALADPVREAGFDPEVITDY